MPEVSIIVPNFNHARYLPERLASIQEQTFQDWELILLDDASTDSSKAILENFSDPRISLKYFAEKNSGSPFGLWQKGIEQAQGKYIWIAESDDSSSADFLATLIEQIKNQENVSLVYSASSWISESGKTLDEPPHESSYFSLPVVDFKKNHLSRGTTVYNVSSAVFRRSNALQVDFAKLKAHKYTGDWYFWVSVLQQGLVVRVPQRLNYFRRHTQNVSFKAEAEQLHFKEGLPLVSELLATYPFSFWERLRILGYWTKKIRNQNAKEHLSLLPSMAKILYPFIT